MIDTRRSLSLSTGATAIYYSLPDLEQLIGRPPESTLRLATTGRSTMSDAPYDDNQHRRPHTPPIAGPFLEFDLMRELAQLYEEPEWNSGQNARTLVKYGDFRVVLTALKAHARQPGHQTKGRLSIQMLAGHILVRAEGRTFDLRAGSLLALDQCRRHDVEALEDSAFLLTIAWPGDDREPQAG